MVAAELPLRGKLRAEATAFFIDQRILEVVYQLLHTACTGLNLILTAPNCPVLGAWDI